jgi:hypothetical protein
MIIITNNNFRNAYQKFCDMIKSVHQVPETSLKLLHENKHIQDFCVVTRHYASLDDDEGIRYYIDYDCFCWYAPDGVIIEIGRIHLYDNFLEYQKERMTHMTEGASLN